MFKVDKSFIRLAMRTTAVSASQTTKFAVPVGAFQLTRRQVLFYNTFSCMPFLTVLPAAGNIHYHYHIMI